MSNRHAQRVANTPAPDLSVLDRGFNEDLEYLLDDYARKWGEFLADKQLKRTQIRRFFQDIKAIESRLIDRASFDKNKALISMLKAKAAYATARQDAKVPVEFRSLMNKAVDQAKKDLAQFKGFVQFFEAVVAYHYPKARD